MKNYILVLMVMLCVFSTVNAQTGLTNYGTSSGTAGNYNSFFGYFAGNASTSSGTDNTALGAYAMSANTSGDYNAAAGGYALHFNTSGYQNTAIGWQAMYSNSTGYENTATGYGALNSNTSGVFNTVSGSNAMLYSTTASYNTAHGAGALYSTTTGNDNTSIGYLSLHTNSNGYSNTACGSAALYYNSTGYANTAYGSFALYSNTTATGNTGIGVSALDDNTTGTFNTSLGENSIGNNTTGSYNTGIGVSAGPSSSNLSNTTAVGYSAATTASNQVRIGNSSVTSIGGYANWSNISDGRFKKDVREDVSGLDFIKQLRPVSYIVDKDNIDLFLGVPEKIRQQLKAIRKAPKREMGFIAQEVERIVADKKIPFQGVEIPQSEKDPYAISYATFVVPLVKAVQELSYKLEEQQKIAEEQQMKIELLIDQLSNKIGQTDEKNHSEKASLFQNSPNPFSIGSEITMKIPETVKQAQIIVYNMEGTQMKAIDVVERGIATVKISGNELLPGIYFYALIIEGKIIDTKRMILTK